MLDVAGILILVAGGLGIFHALLALLPGTGSDILTHYENIIPPGKFLNDVIHDYDMLSVVMFISGALAMGFSMSIFSRGRLSAAVAGGVLGIVSIGFLLGSFFALVGLIILAASKREFLLECA